MELEIFSGSILIMLVLILYPKLPVEQALQIIWALELVAIITLHLIKQSAILLIYQSIKN